MASAAEEARKHRETLEKYISAGERAEQAAGRLETTAALLEARSSPQR